MRQKIKCGVLLAAVLTAVAASAPAAVSASSLDPGFGGGGVVTPALPAAAAAHAAGIVDLAQGEGTKVFGALRGLGETGYFGVAGLSGGEAPDPSFGGDGYTDPLVLPWTGINLEAEAEAVAVQPDGKVVVVGYSEEGIRDPTAFAPLLARYSADGSLDPTLAAGGIVGARPHGTGGTRYHDVAVEPDGRILAAGGRNESSSGVGAPAGLVAAYRPDGSLDTAFGESGRTVLKGKGYTSLRAIDLLAGGKVLVAGFRNYRLLLARLDADGRLDKGFGGGDGEVTVDLDAHACCQTAALAAGPDGRIVVAALGGSGQKRRVFLARFLPSGRPDRSFGTDGVEATLRSTRLTVLNGLAVEPDGSIVTVGRGALGRSSAGTFAAFRNLPSGPPDPSFGRQGLETTVSAGNESSAGAALATPSGILVGGSFAFSPPSGPPRTGLLLARFSE